MYMDGIILFAKNEKELEQRTTNNDITSWTWLIKIIFCQPRLSPELFIHKVSHALLSPLAFYPQSCCGFFFLFPVNLPLARSGCTGVLRRGVSIFVQRAVEVGILTLPNREIYRSGRPQGKSKKKRREVST